MFRSPLLLLLTLLSSATTTTVAAQTPPSCEPASCGHLRITYPFWLGGMHPPECGYRAFRVTCDHRAGKALLEHSVWTYQILDISYQDSSLRIKNVELSHGMCDAKLQVNASSNLGLAPFGISAANQELFFLYNCSGLPPPPTWAPMYCASTGSKRPLNNSFAWLAGAYKPDDITRQVQGNCTASMMPVLGYKGAAGVDYQRLMEDGFLIEYTAGDCAAWMESGGICRTNITNDIFGCHCPDGFSSSNICAIMKTGTKIVLIAAVLTSGPGDHL